jgi:hypothetical protein
MLTRNCLKEYPALLVVIGALLAVVPAAGEVSVNTDPEGDYLYTSILVSEAPNDILFWTPVRNIASQRFLNPQGDLYGDGRPAVIDDRRSGSPVVVWTRPSGRATVLVWSTWEGNGWTPPRWLHPLSGAAGDFDPVLATDASGRIHLVWWRDEGGKGRVFWSRFLGQGGWTPPRPISPAGADARYPAVDLESDRPGILWFDKRGKRVGTAPLSPSTGDQVYSTANEKIQSGSDGLTDDPDVLP